jgi:hypothetical protein
MKKNALKCVKFDAKIINNYIFCENIGYYRHYNIILLPYYNIYMAALDAFGRLRVAGCFTTFNYYPSLVSENTNLDIDVWVSRQTGGTQTYDTQNFINMPITTGASNYSLRTTKQPMIYQPGKSRLIYMTGVLMTSTGAGTDSHMGLFSVDTSTPPVITVA